MTKNEFIENVVMTTELNKKEVASVIDATIDEIKETIRNNDKVSFVGFGTFEPKISKARKGINPATKEKIYIPECQSVKFKVSKKFKEELNK